MLIPRRTWDACLTWRRKKNQQQNDNLFVCQSEAMESRKWFPNDDFVLWQRSSPSREPVSWTLISRRRFSLDDDGLTSFSLGVCFFGNASILCGTADFLLVSLFTCDFIHIFFLLHSSPYIYSRRRNGAVVSSWFTWLFYVHLQCLNVCVAAVICFGRKTLWSWRAFCP